MTSFLLALTRTVVAESLLITITSLLITITSLLGTDMARAAGALAIGTCGARLSKADSIFIPACTDRRTAAEPADHLLARTS